jgi:vacuolar protein sorting-associated protein 13A/C
MKMLLEHYKGNFYSLFTKSLGIIGSIDVLGNPVGLFKNIASGVQDFYEKPIEGMSEGAIEGGIGIAKGTGSLVKNTFEGATNTVSKLTRGVGTGLTMITLVDFNENFGFKFFRMKNF